jgi:hypothetical protein
MLRREEDQTGTESMRTGLREEALHFTNQFILTELENMAKELYSHFELETHGVIWRAYEYLYISDRDLREKIAKALIPDHESITNEPIDEKELNEIIELQSFYNAVRLQLLDQITQHIISYYDNALEIIKKDLEQGTIQYQRARILDTWYIDQLNNLKPQGFNLREATEEEIQSSYSIKLWIETMETFRTVHDSAELALKKIFSSALDNIKAFSKTKSKFNFD